MTDTSRISRYVSNHLPEKTPLSRLLGGCWVAALLWFAFLGAALGNPGASISVTGGTLALPATTSGTAGSFASFNVSGSNLVEAPGNLTVTAPANIQVSSDGVTFGTSATIPFTSITLSATQVYAKLAGTGTVGTISGNISVSGGGATTVNQAANGLLTPVGTSTAVQTPGTVTARKVTFFNNIANSGFSGTFGWQFQVGSADILVNSLGSYDNAGTGLLSSHQTGIWDSTGTLIASATVQVGAGSPLSSHFRYEEITPVRLKAGATYTIGCFYPANNAEVLFIQASQPISPEITFGKAVQTSLAAMGASFAEPTLDESTYSQGFFGPNFQYTTVPGVTTPTATNIGLTSAVLGGDVVSDGGLTITQRGVLYALTSVNPNPTLGGTGVTELDDAAQTLGVMTESATGLTAGSNYSFVAFATNSIGTGYTSPVSTFVTFPPPSISIAFGAASIPLNGSTSLTYTITNPNPSNSLTGVAFTDTLPAGLVVATPNGQAGSIGGGTVSAVAGGGTISLSAATIPGGGSLSFSINVTGTSVGVKSNSAQVTCTEAGNGNTSNASLTVVSPPGITAAFGVPSIPLNGSTTLRFSFSNSNPTTTLTGVGFTATLPAGLMIATPNGLTGGVGGGTITAVAGSNMISLTGGTLGITSGSPPPPTNGTSFTINVIGSAAGTQNLTTSSITSTNGGTGGTASASVNVVAPPSISMAFNPAGIPINGTSTLTITLTNRSSNPVALTGVAFTDTLPAGLVVATPNGLVNTAGGTATATAGSGSISLTGGSLAVNSSATVTVNVTGSANGTYTNTTGNVSTSNGGTGGTATASLSIGAPPTIANGGVPDQVVTIGKGSINLDLSHYYNEANPGITLTYAVVSNSAPTYGTAVATGGSFVQLSPGTVHGSTQVVVSATDGNTAPVTESFKLTTATANPSFKVSSKLTPNKQTGLLEQAITVTNTTGIQIGGFRIAVTNLPSKFKLQNATTAPNIVDYLNLMEPDASVVVTLQFYSPTRSFGSYLPSYTVTELPPTKMPRGSGEGESIDRSIVLSPGVVLIEFAARLGHSYQIQYSDDLGMNWLLSPSGIKAGANKVQWIDRGPPYTISPPATSPVIRRYLIDDVTAR